MFLLSALSDNIIDLFCEKSSQDKASHLGAFFPYAIVYCYLEFKLRSLKNLKLFSIKVKELLEVKVLWKKCDKDLLFLKTFSWEI